MNIFWRYLACTSFIHLVFPCTNIFFLYFTSPLPIKVFMVRAPLPSLITLLIKAYVNRNDMFLQPKFLRIKFYWQVSHFPPSSYAWDDWQAAEMKSSNSLAESRRLIGFVPSIRPSFLSVVLVFVCGCLWVKNETTNERLIALESRVNLFPCVQSVSTENTDRMSLSPTEATERDLYKKVQTHVSERIDYTSGKIFTLDVI